MALPNSADEPDTRFPAGAEPSESVCRKAYGAANLNDESSFSDQTTPTHSDRCPDDEAKHSDRRRSRVAGLLTYGLVPAIALLAVAAAYLKWEISSSQEAQLAAAEARQAATDGAVAILTYQSDTVEKDLGAARDTMTDDFVDSYNSLIHDVVIPAAKERQISAVATVPAGAAVVATTNRAVVLLFVNQKVTVGSDPPAETASSVRVTLKKINRRWLISAFDPV